MSLWPLRKPLPPVACIVESSLECFSRGFTSPLWAWRWLSLVLQTRMSGIMSLFCSTCSLVYVHSYSKLFLVCDHMVPLQDFIFRSGTIPGRNPHHITRDLIMYNYLYVPIHYTLCTKCHVSPLNQLGSGENPIQYEIYTV
jgi:hypothetical protein